MVVRWRAYCHCGHIFLSMIRGILYRIKAEAAPKYLPVNLPSGVTFHDGVIVYRDGERVWPEPRSTIYVLGFSMVFAALFTPGLNAETSGVHVRGPWYFVGLQEILHWTSRPKGQLLVIGKNSGKVYHPKAPAPVCSNQISGHRRLTCQSCHTPWAPSCIQCHTSYDKEGRAVDHVTGKQMKGRWI